MRRRSWHFETSSDFLRKKVAKKFSKNYILTFIVVLPDQIMGAFLRIYVQYQLVV